MQKTVLAFISISTFLLMLSSCEPRKQFQYKETLEDWVDHVNQDDIPRLFGTWTITEIAQVGGSLQPEEEIQRQIGKKLVLSSGRMISEIFHEEQLNNPVYEILSKNIQDADLKTSSFFYSYRPCRETINYLLVHHSENQEEYFEIIHFEELIRYSDGRLYFYHKVDTE